MAKTARNTRKPSLTRRLRAAFGIFRASGTQSLDKFDRWMDTRVSGTDAKAMAFTAYFSGVMQISQSIASVACPLFKREGEGRRRPWVEHPVFRILNHNSNQFVDSLIWRELNIQYAINWGNAYSWIKRDSFGRPVEVFLLESARMKIELKPSGEPVYIYTLPKGGTKTYDLREIFHFHGFGPDAYQGYSLISLFKGAIDLGLQQENFGNNFIKNGIHTSGVLTHPKVMDDAAQSRFRKGLKNMYAGSNNAGTFLILEDGMTWNTMSMPLKDAEFLGGRVFQIQEVARMLNMPPHKLKDMSHATFSNIEHQQIDWGTGTLRPWAERFEKAIDTQLLTPIESGKGFAEHNLRQLQRGDAKAEMEAIRIGRFAGIFTADQALASLGLNPVDDPEVGKRLWQPSNMMDAGSEAAANGGDNTGGTGNENVVQDTGEE